MPETGPRGPGFLFKIKQPMPNTNSRKNELFPGLTDSEVLDSRIKHGSNVLTSAQREPWWKLYLEKYNDPVIRILLIAAFIALLVGISDGHYIEGLGIIVAVLLATTLAFANEFAANRKFDILNLVSDDVPVKVVRNGGYHTLPRKELVVGDLVMVETGEEIPADGVLLEAVSLQVDESRLTGESLPVSKNLADHAEQKGYQTTFAEDFLLRETFVSDGHGVFKISAVGDQTEIGKTARAASEETNIQTPLNKQLEKLSKIIGLFGFSIAFTIYIALVLQGALSGEMIMAPFQWFVTGVLSTSVLIIILPVWLPMVYDLFDLIGSPKRRPDWLVLSSLVPWLISFLSAVLFAGFSLAPAYLGGWLSMPITNWLPVGVGPEFLKYFMISVTIIVVAVPEGLAMSVTLSLAYSMRKMTESNNLVRRMHACETIGAATVICTDKTGTLTRNEMKVESVYFEFLSQDLKSAAEDSSRHLIIDSFAANSTAQLEKSGENSRAIGNPTEGALLHWLDKAGIDYQKARSDFQISQQWTFNTERKFMATMGHSQLLGKPILLVKGAPEIILNRCDSRQGPKGIESLADKRPEIEQKLKEFQKRGMRTLAFGAGMTENHLKLGEITDIANGLIWLGYVAIADPVRDEVPGAIQACKKAGIQVKIVTGDVAETAEEIGRQIGLLNENEPDESNLTGPDFGGLDDKAAMEAAQNVKILSRARPLDKLRLVKLLQKQNHVVAVTGDGVNDAPALNHADVGLAMGKAGTAVAKEASDIILLDDSFNSIVNAVMWGRSLYQNIQRFVLFQITINIAALFTALVGPFIGVKLPLTIIQMLWINLIMDTFAALALATEPPDKSVLDHPPRQPDDFIISPRMLKQILITAIAFFAGMVSLLLYFQQDGFLTPRELSLFFNLFVFLQFWNLFNAKVLGQKHSILIGLTSNKAFLLICGLILVGQIVIIQFGGTVFRTVPLSLKDWIIIVFGSSSVLIIGESWRLFQRIKIRRF